ncbi:alpha/beta fold hydrolase [Aquimarina sp. LLG6339-5]|uniref:alpha/beta fold hydrolase n=1 Tax=Aquimarina sp. LLG6339-5 TaxID=3160830 RepID=UPI00386B6A4D
MRSTVFQFLLLSGFLLLFQNTSSQIANFEPSFKESKKLPFKIKKNQNFTFGYLTVLEDRSKPNGKTIKLPVYIFKSRSKTPQKDPIIYTVGGPGSSTMYSAPYMEYYKYLDDRDFILFEQRGTKFAKPHLDCPEWGDATYFSNQPEYSNVQKDSAIQDAAKKCRERLLKEGNNINTYKTTTIAEDIEDLRKALGIETYNLLTISYSTKIAQVLMRDYPKNIRSVVMDSPLPLEVNYAEESIQNLLNSYHKLFEDCKKDRGCNEAYPNLEERFFNSLLEKTKEPLQIKILSTNGKKESIFRLRGKDLIGFFGQFSTSDIPNVPGIIDQFIKEDYNLLKESLRSSMESKSDGEGMGMRLSVWCAEETSFVSDTVIKAESNKYPSIKGTDPYLFDLEICEIWNVNSETDTENKPVISTIPVLLISGEYDNATPEKWAKQMLPNLKNGFHLTFKGWLHTPTTNWGNPCAMEAANQFFNNPSKKPNPACFKKIGTPKFVY